jgi:hypothetical protein
MKKLFSAIWKGLGEKGKFATIIGTLFAAPYNVKFMIDFFGGVVYSYDQLLALAVVNGLGMVWFILPSKITIEGGKFKFIVED